LADDSLQSADNGNKKALLWQGNRTYDVVVKFDTYRNLQLHRAVLPVIARLACLQLGGAYIGFYRKKCIQLPRHFTLTFFSDVMSNIVKIFTNNPDFG